MAVPSALLRLSQLEGHIRNTARVDAVKPETVLVLPNGETVIAVTKSSGTTVLSRQESNEIILSYQPLDAPPVALELSSVGTRYEGQTTHLPTYPILHLHVSLDEKDEIDNWWAGLYALLSIFPEQEHIPVSLTSQNEEFRTYLIRTGLGRPSLSRPKRQNTAPEYTRDIVFVLREAFWQGAGMAGVSYGGWLPTQPTARGTSLFPHVASFTRTPTVIASHPLRPPKPRPGEVLYRRWCPSIGETLEVIYLDLEGQSTEFADDGQISKHVDAFHRWQNSERVSQAWKETGTLAEHKEYLRGVLADPAVLPCMMAWNGELMGYTELFWLKENHMAQYFPSIGVLSGPGEWDRGIHVLMGEERFRGSDRALTWLQALSHYLFLADSRTERVFGEPEARNIALAKIGFGVGYYQQMTFDFPYKRSRMMIMSRQNFFRQGGMR